MTRRRANRKNLGKNQYEDRSAKRFARERQQALIDSYIDDDIREQLLKLEYTEEVSYGTKSQKKRTGKRKYEPKKEEIKFLTPLTYPQEELVASIERNPITIAYGSAGTGKTLMTLHSAVQMFQKRQIEQILYIKPITEFKGEKGVGFLKGEIEEKLSPLLSPIKDNLPIFVVPERAEYMFNRKQIDVEILEYLRGRSLRNTFVIYDETQNTTPHGIITVISRLEKSSKLVILGDPSQSDVPRPKGEKNGLEDAIIRLDAMEGTVGIVKFTPKDIVRSPYLASVIERYER